MLKLLALFFGLHSAYSFWGLYDHREFSAFLSGALSAAAAIGLWQERRWAQYVVYVITAFVMAYFAWYIWALVRLGWPYEDNVRSFVSLVPGTLILTFAVGASVHVFRALRGKS
jgi:hypothetical protein